ncbi:hypothetical protein K523DRAFT_341145 [Schizophyllum commune Tattone D]|nr:hypothetical protein K523DRAFT_341145 [Schizophyllum commune Tattone D]
MPAATTTVDLSPQGLINKDNNYILQQEGIYDLLKYSWTGVLLPITEEQYQTRVQISGDVADKYADQTKRLLKAYATAQKHCAEFKQITYPSIVALASAVYDYAQNAGGDVQDSYYANIVQSVDALSSTETSSGAMEAINGLVDTQVQAINAIVRQAQSAINALVTFGVQMKNDHTDMKGPQDALTGELSDTIEHFDGLQAQLEKYRAGIKADQQAYEHDKIVACTTLTYAWVPFFGMIASSVVAGIYGKKAAEMADRIDAVNKLISSDESEINAGNPLRVGATRIAAELMAVDTAINDLHSACLPAIDAINAMVKTLQSVAGALTTLKELAASNPRQANRAIAGIDVTKLVAQWNALAAAADKYRQAANIVEAPAAGGEPVTLESLSKQLHEQAKVTK